MPSAANILSSVVTTRLTTTIISQFASIPTFVVTQSTSAISQFASFPIPVTQLTTATSQFASIPTLVVTQSTTNISQFASSSHSTAIKLSPQSTPTCMHFETVATTPKQSRLPTVPSSGIFNTDKTKAPHSASCSRRNFSARLVTELFDEDTRKCSNVSGKLGKLKLNPVLMYYAKYLAFQFYPLEHSESEKVGKVCDCY